MIPNWIKQTQLYSRLRDQRYLARNKALRSFYGEFISPKDLVFDIGANVGHYSLIFQSLGAKVIAIEPQQHLIEGLKKRFKTNQQVILAHTAIGATSGNATLHKTSDLSEVASLRADVGETSRFAEEHPFTETETVPMQTFTELIDRYGKPDFCKIDVEGFEHHVLATLSQPIATLSLEFNREYFDVAEDCVAKLSNLGPYEFNHTLGEATSLNCSNWINGNQLLDSLRESPDPLLWGDIYARIPTSH